MDETEGMVALKKAFAEMILNTSKEAAARVMAAERKAHKFEQDLLSTKEEALRMLLRLKQMIDAKNSEAELTSLNQKNRIHELEAQLDEAEGLILDLRAKLSKVEEQLDDLKSKNMHPLRQNEKVELPSHIWKTEKEQSYFASLKSFSEFEPKPLISDIHASPSEPSFLVRECLTSAKGTEFDHCPVDDPVFASGITKSTEPELYRNGCIQRTRAIETGLADEKLHPTDEIVSLLRSTPIVMRKVQNVGSDAIPSSRSETLDLMDNFLKQAPLTDNTMKGQPIKIGRNVCRRKARYGKGKATSCRNLTGKSMKLQRTSSAISRCKSHLHTSKNVNKSGDTSTSTDNMNKVNVSGLEKNVPLENYLHVSIVRRSLRKRKVKHWDDFATSSRPHDACTHSGRHDDPCQNNKVTRTVAKAVEDVLGVEHGGEFEEGIHSKAAVVTVSKHLKVEEGSSFVGTVAEEDFKLIDKSMLVQLSRLTPGTELENMLAPSDSRDRKISELTNKAPSQPDSNKPLKYTFSRKRKKGPSTNSNENNSSGEISVKKRSGEENGILLAPMNRNMVDESSSYSRGLVQVAHQLISLSAKRWW